MGARFIGVHVSGRNAVGDLGSTGINLGVGDDLHPRDIVGADRPGVGMRSSRQHQRHHRQIGEQPHSVHPN